MQLGADNLAYGDLCKAHEENTLTRTILLFTSGHPLTEDQVTWVD